MLVLLGFIISVVNIVRFIEYKSVQDLATIRLPFKKIKEFYNLAPEKYSTLLYSRGVFKYYKYKKNCLCIL